MDLHIDLDSSDLGAELPSYESVTNIEESVEDQVHGPVTLYVAGRFIHTNDHSSPPLYEFSHSIGFLSDADRTVSVHRIDQIVTSRQGRPVVQDRKRHLFDLKHPTKGEYANFKFQAEVASRRALCCLGISAFHPRRSLLSSLGNAKRKGYWVHRAVRGADRRLEEKDVVFGAAPSRDRAVGFEWRDAEGELLAREVETNELMSLVVTAELTTATRDALVAAWMLRLWYELSQGNYRENKWDTAIRVLKSSNPEVRSLRVSSMGLY
ncbi:hypothetical protein BGZ63DRAFT_395452 [Mariannaea sp. PMI_226]|nr:hypothetical protein BGZ63DRAFT_395452 [Mariannaea sp. PMI_226]